MIRKIIFDVILGTQMKYITLILTLLTATSAFSAVWEDTNSWSMDWEKKYSEWIQTDKVHTRMFTSKKSKYYGINADCADAAYALRAIFSLENALPFKVHAPKDNSSELFEKLSNKTDKFDETGSTPEKRLVAMINYLGKSIGTEHLSHIDTIPVKIDKIAPGMLFTYKIKGGNGNFIRHAYSIKDVSEYGNFDVIYSTQAIARDKLPMMRKSGFIFTNIPHGSWGFRRWKWPSQEGLENDLLPDEMGYSKEQYDLVRKHGQRFFRVVKDKLKTSEEHPQDMLLRKIKLVCQEAQPRATYVNQGLDYRREIGNRCMSYEEYDAYSTPTRDENLWKSIETLKTDFNEVIYRNLSDYVNPRIMDAIKSIFKGYNFFQTSVRDDLNSMCIINYRSVVRINLHHIYDRLSKGLMTSHPNDGIVQRWGETAEGRTRCRKWY